MILTYGCVKCSGFMFKQPEKPKYTSEKMNLKQESQENAILGRFS